MAFVVNDLVKKSAETQKYKVVTVLTGSKYECIYEPELSAHAKFTFKEADLVAA